VLVVRGPNRGESVKRSSVSVVTEQDVLLNLVNSVAPGEAVVQIGTKWSSPQATMPGEAVENNVGLLHLGSESFAQFEVVMPYLVQGAIVLFEGCLPETPSYVYAVDWAARGYLTSPTEARHFDALGICTYLGKGK
jgi:hypothetical protein